MQFFLLHHGMNLPSDSAAPPAKRHKPSCCFFTSHQSRKPTSQIEEDARRKTVLEQWAVLIMAVPQASLVGRQVLLETKSRAEHATILHCGTFIDDVLAMKSTATLVKRLGALRRFFTWCSDQKCVPLPFSDSVLYTYLDSLREQGAAPSSGRSFLEAVHFTSVMFGIDGGSVTSKRVQGVAAKMAINAPPLKQALALSVDHVQALEHIAVSADTAQERCLAGSLLVLLYARCHFGDGQRASSLSLDMSAASSASVERGFLELSMRTHKTATSLQRRRRILPVVAPIFSLSGCRCHKAWLDARQALKLPVEGDMRVPLLPFFDVHGTPTERGLTTSEGGALLRNLLQTNLPGVEVPHYTAHSLKVTCLAWLAKFGTSLAMRRILGYHVAPGASVAETYARDSLAAPLRELVRVLEAVKSGRFRPDDTRSGMLNECASPRPAEAETDSWSSESECEAEELDDSVPLLRLLPATARPQLLTAAAGRKIYRHKYSGICHIIKDGHDAFECGKSLTANFAEIISAVETIVRCKGCYVESKAAIVAVV